MSYDRLKLNQPIMLNRPILTHIDFLLLCECLEDVKMSQNDRFYADSDDDSYFLYGDELGDVQIDISDILDSTQQTKPDQLELIDNATMREVKLDFYEDWDNLDPILSADEISVDIETTGLDPRNRIRSLQLYLPNIDKVCYLDLWDLTSAQTRFFEAFKQQLANPQVKKYLQNAMFDLFWFYWKFRVLGLNIVDTRILSQIDKAGKYEGYKFEAGIDAPNGLENLSIEFGYEHDKSNQSSDWSRIPLDPDQIAYAGRDPYVTYKIGRTLYDRLMTEQPEVVTAELGSIPVFVYMQYIGLPCDPSRLFLLGAKYLNAATKAKEELSKLMPYDPCHHAKIERQMKLDPKVCYGKQGQLLKAWKDKPFSVSSPSQVTAYLHSLGYQEYTKKTDKKTGDDRDSSAKDVLFEIYSDHPHQTELLDIINYRGVAKAASTLDSYYKTFCPMRKSIRVSYSVLAIQGMGRSSSGGKAGKDYQNPHLEPLKVQNAQNISKHLPSHIKFGLDPIRSVVQARPGFVLAEIDLAASHAQFARYLSKDTSLQESYDSGVKLHYYTLASMLAFEGLSVTPQECIDLVSGKADKARVQHYKHLYKLAKTVFYCFLNYGGAATLQVQFFKFEMFVSLKDCAKYLDACANAFCELRLYQERVHRDAKRRIQPVNSPIGIPLGHFGYSLPCDGSRIWHRAQYNKQGERDIKISDVVSAQWLRPEATVMKTALAQILDKCLVWGLDEVIRIITFTHDSVLLEIRKEEIENTLPVCHDIINTNMKRFIPDYQPEESWEACVIGEYWK